MIVQSTMYQVPSRKYGGNRIEIPAAAGSLREKGLKTNSYFPSLLGLFLAYFDGISNPLLALVSCF